MRGETHCLTSTSNERCLRNFSDRFIFCPSFCQKSAERESSKKIFSLFCFDAWPEIQTRAFTSNKPTYYLKEGGTWQFILGFSNTPKKILQYFQWGSLITMMRNDLDFRIFVMLNTQSLAMVKYCHPLQWKKFTDFYLNWNISIIPKSSK